MGDRAKDHASIVAAFKRARPGDTLQFARGMYVVGELIQVPTPRLTLLGDANGTVLRGCNPEAYEQRAREEARIISALIKSHHGARPGAHWRDLVKHCGMFRLTGGHDSVRNLTFEYMRLGLMLGYRYQLGHLSTKGGYLVEGNTFRNTDNGVRIGVSSPEPTVVSHNTFVDTYHAVEAGGSNIRILDNTILAPAPGRVPGQQHPSNAIGITAIVPGFKNVDRSSNGRCTNNVIAGNVIDGYPDGIVLTAFPGMVCSRNVIRGNTVAVRRVALLRSSVDFGLFPLPDKTHPSFVGVPIEIAAPAFHGRSGLVVGNRIEGNRILGAEGYGIALVHASNNRIAGNTVTGVVLRDPFPGNASGSPSPHANGAGIWLSAGSDGNDIAGNDFEDIAAYAIVVEGDRNVVKVRRSRDTVHDLGAGNHVMGPKGDRQTKTQAQQF